jgi:hypothetical protein
MAMHLLTQPKNNVSAPELERHLGLCYRTAWLIKHKILEGMRPAEADRPLTGRVKIKDAFLWGERSEQKAGRGSKDKVPFVAAVQITESGLQNMACLPQRPFTKDAMEGSIARHKALHLMEVPAG